jgi:hypothetical protein
MHVTGIRYQAALFVASIFLGLSANPANAQQSRAQFACDALRRIEGAAGADFIPLQSGQVASCCPIT